MSQIWPPNPHILGCVGFDAVNLKRYLATLTGVCKICTADCRPFDPPIIRRTRPQGLLCRTKRPFALAAIADAAFVRGCRAIIAALRPKSPFRSFKTMTRPGFQTALSPLPRSTIKTRTKLPLSDAQSMSAFAVRRCPQCRF